MILTPEERANLYRTAYDPFGTRGLAVMVEKILNDRLADAWRAGWLAMGREHMRQRSDATYPIGRDVSNPYGDADPHERASAFFDSTPEPDESLDEVLRLARDEAMEATLAEWGQSDIDRPNQ